MFISSESKNGQGLLVPEPWVPSDARILLLENYPTITVGSEMLAKRPDCLGALISDTQDWSGPAAILVVDRETHKTVLRIAKLQDYLTR